MRKVTRLTRMLSETQSSVEKGGYTVDGRTVPLTLSKAEIREAQVFLPGEVEYIVRQRSNRSPIPQDCRFSCENEDSFALACRRMKECCKCGYSFRPGLQPDILVLNMANSFNPGGGVRHGALAQGEDLCRTSTLLFSLESDAARPYYVYNRGLNSELGSDAVIISPWVDVFRQRDGQFLEKPRVVSVLSCAAPVYRDDWYGLGEQGYNEAIYRRIKGMLCVAANRGYRHLILGAFGCGAFENDPVVVSDLFKRAIQELQDEGIWFDRIDFAVLDHSIEKRNYREFSRNFTMECENEIRYGLKW